MKLRKLLKNIQIDDIKGSRDVEISGVCSHSKRVGPGNLFIAKKGIVSDGHQFLPEAVDAGAVAVVTDLFDPTLPAVQVIHSNPAEIEAKLAAEFHGYPSDQLFMVGVTGTNGKTTTTYLVKQIFDLFGETSGLIGTIEYLIGDQSYIPTHTTPDVTANQKMLHEMVLNGCSAACLEVTSHALEQGRVSCVDFDVAIFTNLSHDHLDYHHTMEQYARAKAKLFNEHMKKQSTAVINQDSKWHKEIVQNYSGPLLTYGFSDGADIQAKQVELTMDGSRFLVCYKDQQIPCSMGLFGRHNVENALAAIGACLLRGYTLEQILPKFKHLKQVSGRLEPVKNRLGIQIYVDFAHTPEALENAIHAVSELNQGRLAVVFGCGGDRDKSKRPVMAAIAEKGSDFVIVTTDNPRSEDPKGICAHICEGFTLNRHSVVLDRLEAISQAIQWAKPGDTVLIAGKGHEKTQICSYGTVEFDDVQAAQTVCEKIEHSKQKVCI